MVKLEYLTWEYTELWWRRGGWSARRALVRAGLRTEDKIVLGNSTLHKSDWLRQANKSHIEQFYGDGDSVTPMGRLLQSLHRLIYLYNTSKDVILFVQEQQLRNGARKLIYHCDGDQRTKPQIALESHVGSTPSLKWLNKIAIPSWYS